MTDSVIIINLDDREIIPLSGFNYLYCGTQHKQRHQLISDKKYIFEIAKTLKCICRRQYQKSGITSNAKAISEIPLLPRHYQKC